MSEAAFIPVKREHVEQAIETLLALLDEMEPDPDIEDCGDAEPDEDGEPSICVTHDLNQERAWRRHEYLHEVDLEAEHDGREPDDEDVEHDGREPEEAF